MGNVINNIIEYLSNNHLIDDNTLKEYIMELVNQEKIADYVSNINISYGKGSSYNNIRHEITINPIELFYERNTGDFEIITMDNLINYVERKYKICSTNKLNIYNIFQINHELTHVFQNIIYNEGSIDDWYTGLLSKCLILMTIDEKYFNEKYYNLFHEEFFSEYDANTNAYIMTLSLLNEINIKGLDKLIKKFNMIIAKNILSLYRNIFNKNEISTPSLNTIRLFNMLKHRVKEIDEKEYNEICNFEKHSYDCIRNLPKPKNQFDRLELGLSLDNKTLKYIHSISTGGKKTKNLFDDIKNIS